MSVQWRRATTAVGYGAARLRGCERGAAHVLVAQHELSLSVRKLAQKKMGRSTWFRHNRRIPIPRIRFSLRLTGALSCRQGRKAARVPPGRHWRAAAGSHWTAPGRPLGQMCTKPRPPAVPSIGGPAPPVRQDPQASTAANPLDGLQATAKAPSFTGGSRLVQLLGLLDWLARQRRIPEAPVGTQRMFQRFRSRSSS